MFLPSSVRCVVCLLGAVGICLCVHAHTINCSVAMKLWGSALAIRHKPTVAWESMSPRQ